VNAPATGPDMIDTLATGIHTAAPLYKEVKRLLTQGLAAGEWQPGEALPSETRLAERFKVSIGTLRKAVDELVAEQVLVRQQGRGTFVATHGANRMLFNFFHIVRTDGARVLPDAQVVEFGRSKAEAGEAMRLGLAAGERVLRIRNLMRLEGKPVLVDDIVLAAARFPDLTERVFREREGTIYGLYQTRYAINVVRARERLRVALLEAGAARLLGLPAGHPVLEINRTALSYHDRPVELRRSLVNTAHHEYVSDLGKA